MKILKSLLVVAALAFAGPAAAHDHQTADIGWEPPAHDPTEKKWHDPNNPFHWYPSECCSSMDCAPADTIERVPEWNGRWMSNKHGRVWVPDSKKLFTAKDKDGKEVDFTIPAFEKNRTHVCMRKPYAGDPKPAHGDMHVICIFGEAAF